MMDFDVNYLPIVVAAVVSMVLGGLWYSPLLFGKIWMNLQGLKMSDMEKHKDKMGQSYALGFLMSLVMSFVLAQFLSFVGASTLNEGLEVAFWLWLGFIGTVTLGSVLWENKPFKLYFLNNAYNLLSMLLMAGILTLWE